MKYFARVVLLPLSVVLGPLGVVPVHAEEVVSSSACAMSSPQDVIECALLNHPEAQRARLSLAQAENFRDAAAQRPNPELDGRTTYGRSLGDTIVGVELSIAHTIELGGKRSARIDKALAERDVAGAEALKSREEVLLDTIHSLYRVRQLQIEEATLDEALETFSRIQRQFRSRPRRTPEQEVSLAVFGMAEGDYKLRKAGIETEIAKEIRTISLATGHDFKVSPNLLPKRKAVWPDLEDNRDPTSFEGSAAKNARASLKLAEAELGLAQSASWPNLRIGPTVESQTQGPITYQTYGINMSFELPVLQINGGGRAVGQAGVDLAGRSASLRSQELAIERAILIQNYRNSVAALRGSMSLSEVERRHQNAEALFSRGIIPSSLVIEAHRQIVDFTKNQNEQELSALQALWRIYVLEGRAFEEKL